MHDTEVVFFEPGMIRESGFSLRELLNYGGGLIGCVVVAAVKEQQCQVGGSDEATQVGFDVRIGHRGSVDQLHGDIFPGHDRRQRFAGGERVVGHLGAGVGQLVHQATLARVGCSEEYDLSGTLAREPVAAARLAGLLLGGTLAAGFLESAAETSLHPVGPLVLGDDREHFLEALDAFHGRARLPVGVFGLLVLGCEIGRHV